MRIIYHIQIAIEQYLVKLKIPIPYNSAGTIYPAEILSDVSKEPCVRMLTVALFGLGVTTVTYDTVRNLRSIIVDDKTQVLEGQVHYDTIYIKQMSTNGPNLACHLFVNKVLQELSHAHVFAYCLLLQHSHRADQLQQKPCGPQS